MGLEKSSLKILQQVLSSNTINWLQSQVHLQPIGLLCKFFIKKTESNHGCDDLIRQLMPVSGERKFDQRDVHGLTIIDDQETAEFCRLSESENHKTFDVELIKRNQLHKMKNGKRVKELYLSNYKHLG